MMRPAINGCLLVLVSLAGLAACGSDPVPDVTNDSRARTPIDALSQPDDDDSIDSFKVATKPADIRFPRDHGAHPEFRTEWWYFTGNLEAEDHRHFGFQLTFFRYALNATPAERESAWAANQVWMAHFTVTDSEAEQFFAEERFSRDAFELAGATASPFRVWLSDWQATGSDDDLTPMRVSAATDNVGLNLVLDSNKPIVLQGDGGFDVKGPEPGNASYYYSLTRMPATGTLRIGKQEHPVSGDAWMDREWSTSALSAGLAGWDWFGLQLDDGTELMLYRLRGKDGTTSPFSGGSLVSPEGTVTRLTAEDIEVRVIDQWQSPSTDTVYPVAWQVTVPDEAINLYVVPAVMQQELDLTVRYWEGAVFVAGQSGARDIEGHGYLELVGY